MKMKILHLIAVILALTFVLCTASAEVVQPGDDFWYLDESGVLSEATEGEIFFANQRLYDACGAEIVVVAIDSTGSMAIDDYAYTLFNNWQIGGNSYRGLLLLMAIKDDNYYAMPGTNMGVYFDSATLNEMLDTYLEPDFAKKDYDSGARRFFEAAYEKTVDILNLNLSIADAKADYNAYVRDSGNAQQKAAANAPQARYEYEQTASGNALLILLGILFVLIMIFGRSRRAYHRPYRNYVRPMTTGFILGRMASRRNSFHNPMHGGPRMGGMPPMGQPGRMSRPSGSSFGNRSSGRSTVGFGGISRSSGGFGGAGRSSGGGFGGASRSGGASRGPSTRGGGSGRFSR